MFSNNNFDRQDIRTASSNVLSSEENAKNEKKVKDRKRDSRSRSRGPDNMMLGGPSKSSKFFIEALLNVLIYR